MGAMVMALLDAVFGGMLPARARPDGAGARLQAWLGTPYTAVVVGLWILTGALACEQTLFERAALWQPFVIASVAAFLCGLLLVRPQPQPAVGALVALFGPLAGVATALFAILVAGMLPSLPGWG